MQAGKNTGFLFENSVNYQLRPKKSEIFEDPKKIQMTFCSWAKSSLMSYPNKCIPKIHPLSGEVESKILSAFRPLYYLPILKSDVTGNFKFVPR